MKLLLLLPACAGLLFMTSCAITTNGGYGSSFDYGDQAAANTQAQAATDTANYENAAAAMSGPPPVPPQ